MDVHRMEREKKKTKIMEGRKQKRRVK